MDKQTNSVPIDEAKINSLLETCTADDSVRINSIMDKARELKGLNLEDVAHLTAIEEPSLLEKLFETARYVKETIYGKRLVLFAPLYISNFCRNDCTYCAFRASNRDIVRRALSQDEIANEVKALVMQGHKRVLLVTGEAYPDEGISYVLKAIETIYKTKVDNGEIRRINVNIAPLNVDEFKELKKANIGTYQIFQETYHRETYAEVHPRGAKRDYDFRIMAMDRAMEAGIDDVGIGVLFGLYDWRFEVLGMMQHVNHLEDKFGVGPHTISIPRLEPALGCEITTNPPHEVSDNDFAKIIAIFRLAVPYTGMIITTRETPRIRGESFSLGISQISAGSRTNPGGYSDNPFEGVSSQFQLGDHRSLDEVIQDAASQGYIPSFCTACYRLGRTGMDFMDLAKPGEIKKHCEPNALTTFLEYILDYGSDDTRDVGEKLIAEILDNMDDTMREFSIKQLEKVRSGKRDVYC